MAKDKKSFVSYSDWNTTFEKLTDEEAGKLVKMIFAYVNDKNPEAPDRMTELLFEPIKNQLKRDLKTYEKTLDEKSRKGRLGNLKRWNEDLFIKVSEGIIELEEAEQIAKNRYSDKKIATATNSDKKIADNVDDDVDVNDNDILLEKETKEEINFFENLSNWEDEELVKPEKEERKKVAQKKERFIPPTVQQVQDYCNERQNGIQANTFVNFYQSKGWLIGKNKMKDWKAAVRTWEQKNKENGITNSTPQFSNTRAFTADKVSGRGNLNSPTIRPEFT